MVKCGAHAERELTGTKELDFKQVELFYAHAGDARVETVRVPTIIVVLGVRHKAAEK